MNEAQRMDAWEQRKSAYANNWKTGLCGAPCNDPACCCIAACCPACASYSLRKRALYGDMQNYRCCGGFLPCSGRLGESNCPQLCLALEACCCFGTSVMVTRWLIQDELRVQNTKCDNCLMATTIFLQQLACICQIAACITGDDTLQQLADIISFIADVMWCSVCACMQTQHKLQLDERDQMGGGGPVHYPVVVTQPPMEQPNPMYERPPATMAYPAPGQPQGVYYGGNPQYPPPGYPTQQPPYGHAQMYR